MINFNSDYKYVHPSCQPMNDIADEKLWIWDRVTKMNNICINDKQR